MRFGIAVLFLAGLACGVQFAGDNTHPTPTPASLSPEIRIVNKVLSPPISTIILAQKGLRLRDRPDQAGPSDSVTILIMPGGSQFVATGCDLIYTQWWANGSYGAFTGWADAEFLSPNPCE